MRVLVVEDDDLFGGAVQRGLTRSGFAVDWTRTGKDANLAVYSHDYDSVLLDLGLPDIPGETLLKSMRSRKPQLSVVVMTARNTVHDRVSLLDMGADDYMVKPVHLAEVGARLRAVVRRAQAEHEVVCEVEYGGLKLLPARRKAIWRGKEVDLTRKEYWLLEIFLRRRSQVLTRAQLEGTLYGWGEEVGSNAVEVYVHFLRRKFCPGLIQTVRGVGYQLGELAALDA